MKLLCSIYFFGILFVTNAYSSLSEVELNDYSIEFNKQPFPESEDAISIESVNLSSSLLRRISFAIIVLVH
jgi:hypothetical protein